MSAAPLLEMDDVEKGFSGQSEPVLWRASLAIHEGEFVAVVGCSGAGKTTLISLLAGLTTPDRGQVRFEGKPREGPGPERAVVFQNYSLLPWLTVFENVLLAVEASEPGLDRGAARARALRFVDLVRLGRAAAKRPRQLSGGMRQRVALARALAMEPRVLLLDEPLSALDALTRATLQDELARISIEARTTIVLVTNDVDEALLLADRVVPLTRPPRATLGTSIEVPISRPRVRTQLSLLPEYQRARRDVLARLSAAARPTSASSVGHHAAAARAAALREEPAQ